MRAVYGEPGQRTRAVGRCLGVEARSMGRFPFVGRHYDRFSALGAG